MKILIADDYVIVRKGLIQIIEDEFPGVEVDEVGSGNQALEKLRSQLYDIAILDITMPGLTGLEVVKTAASEAISTPILVLTSLPESQYAMRVLKAGAAGFIGKESAGEELIKAIRRILSGRKYITESLTEQMVHELSADPQHVPHQALSSREMEILIRLGAGKTVTEISDELSIAITTVSTYRVRILEKMKFKDNVELMRYCLTQRIS